MVLRIATVAPYVGAVKRVPLPIVFQALARLRSKEKVLDEGHKPGRFSYKSRC